MIPQLCVVKLLRYSEREIERFNLAPNAQLCRKRVPVLNPTTRVFDGRRAVLSVSITPD